VGEIDDGTLRPGRLQLQGSMGPPAVVVTGAFQGQWGTDIPLLCAGSLLIMAPTLVIFLVFQRRFVTALLQGSLKG